MVCVLLVRLLLCSNLISTDSNEALYPVRFLVQAMVLFKDSLAQWTPMPKNGIAKENSECIFTAGILRLTSDVTLGRLALSEPFVHNAVILLVDKIIPLKEADLQEWSKDPEEFFNVEDKESDQWEYELRVRFHFSCYSSFTHPSVYYGIGVWRESSHHSRQPMYAVCCAPSEEGIRTSTR